MDSPTHDQVTPRWPVFVRFGAHEEVHVADVYAADSSELLRMMAECLRDLADHLEQRA